MAFILIGNKKVRLPKGETDVEGFAKNVDSIQTGELCKEAMFFSKFFQLWSYFLHC